MAKKNHCCIKVNKLNFNQSIYMNGTKKLALSAESFTKGYELMNNQI